jgi:C-terminal peptidase prc
VPDPEVQPEWLYREVLSKLRNFYVEALPSRTVLASGSVQQMLEDLGDVNTRLLSPTETEAVQNAVNGDFAGLGAVLTIKKLPIRRKPGTEDTANATLPMLAPKKPGAPNVPMQRMIVVVSVVPGSPAEKAGIQIGDRIVELDGRWIAPTHLSYRLLTQLTDPLGPQDGRPLEDDEISMPIKERTAAEKKEDQERQQEVDEARARWKAATDLATAMEALYGGATGKHRLQIERGKDGAKVDVSVDLEPTKVEVFTSKELPKAGYVQFRAFNTTSAQKLSEALSGFQTAGLKNLVIDLRGNAGGSLEAVQNVAGVLLGDAKIAILKERDADRKLIERGLSAKGTKHAFKPAAISVLVDGGTAGSAEVLAAALRDVSAARILGTSTFGDGTYQELVRLENGSGFTLTRARTLTGKGVEFDGKGIQPDEAINGDPLEAAQKQFAAGAQPGKA